MEEQSLEERARLSAPCMRTFVSIARRWQLTERQQAHLLECDRATLQLWANAALGHKPFVLETPTLLRISVVLGVFADLRKVLGNAFGAREERTWLLNRQHISPFNGRSPFKVLSDKFEEQMTVRRHLAVLAETIDPAWVSEVEAPSLSERDLHDPRIFADGIKGICFDGFGTVVEICDKRRPFQALLDREPSETLARHALTQPMSLRQLSEELSAPVTEEQIAHLEADLAAELVSVRLRPGMSEAWQVVRQAGLKIAVCSNLAAPYEGPLVEQLPGEPDALILSFRAKLMKPQPEIYELVCRELGLRPRELLFVGDTLEADVIGPSMIGALSMPISEFERSLEGGASFFAPLPIGELFDRIVSAGRR